MQVNTDGTIESVVVTRNGVDRNFLKNKKIQIPLSISKASSSATMGKSYYASKAFDNHNGTLWAAPNDKPVWIKADLGKVKKISSVIPVFDIVDGDYDYVIECSTDDKNWAEYAKAKNNLGNEWPVELHKFAKARYIRLTILKQTKEPKRIGLWELKIYGK
jgi:hypothetical protein